MDKEDPVLTRDIAAVARLTSVPFMLRLICQDTGMGFAAVARVTDEAWVACAVQDNIDFGLKVGSELAIGTTLCREARASGTPVVIDHASVDPVYRDHHTPKIYGIESYISFPIVRANGEHFGNLCAIDPKPAAASDPRTMRMFKTFAEMIAVQLEDEAVYDAIEAEVTNQRAAALLREQFIAVLGHDLRNPLAAVGTTAELLIRRPEEKDRKLGERLKSSTRRMGALIDNVMDFARVRLGSGIGVGIRAAEHLETSLRAVVDEARGAHPDMEFLEDIDIDVPVSCDPVRMQQLLSNLLGNAYTHGARDKPIEVAARIDQGWLDLSVRNGGEPIAATDLAKIFEPYWRPASATPSQGLGLGLYICSEIVKAHGGTFSASSSATEGTRFLVRVPVVPRTTTVAE
ncbi:MAG: GAF domain-containing sensor histidine kinase [Janthinobacterium lividum]